MTQENFIKMWNQSCDEIRDLLNGLGQGQDLVTVTWRAALVSALKIMTNNKEKYWREEEEE